MKLWAYGDSFVAGDQDIPGRIDAISEHTEYNRYNISFASHLAKKLNAELINRAISGCGNYPQLDKLLLDIENIKTNDIVIFGLTTTWRDRYSLPSNCPQVVSPTRGPSMLHRDLLYNEKLNKLPTFDLFYILSVLEKIEHLFNFPIIKFNAFHDVQTEADSIDKKLFQFKNFIGLNVPGNTLIDLLLNRWGDPTPRIVDHSQWMPPKEYRHLFTDKSHPSIEGHKFIAEWMHNQLIKLGII